jgi:arginase
VRFRGLQVCAEEALQKLAECDLIYISFDVDSMDCDHVSSGTGTPVPIGFFPEEIIQLFDALQSSNKLVCIEFTEVNPLLDNKGNLMAETAFQVLDHLARKI